MRTTIADDDVPVATVSGPASAEEGGTAEYTVRLDRSPSVAVDVDWAVAGTGDAAADEDDFGGTLPTGTVSFDAGATGDDLMRTFTVTVADDGADEVAETFAVTVVSSSGNPAGSLTVGDPASAETTIADGDVPVATVSGPASVGEDAGALTGGDAITVTLDPAPARAVEVAWTIGAGRVLPAVDAADFGAGAGLRSGTVTFAAGETGKEIPVTIADDTTEEPDERFTVTLPGVADEDAAGYSVSDTGGEHTVTITDDDLPAVARLRVSAFPATVRATAFSTVVVHAEDDDGDPVGGRTVTLATDSPTARFDDGTTDGAETIAATETRPGSSGTYRARLSDTAAGTVTVTATVAVPGGDDVTGTATVEFRVPAAAPSAGFVSATASVAEGAGTVGLPVRLSAPAPAGGLEVGYRTRGRSGADGADEDDYVAARGDLAFAEGEQEKEITVTIIDDGAAERDETFDVALVARPGVRIDPRRSSVAVTIEDDDALAFPDTGSVVNYPGRVGQALAPLPAATGGTGAITYSLDPDPALPAGLTFDPATRGFTGLPTEGTPRRTYTLTATDAAGATATLTFAIFIGLEEVTATIRGPSSVDEDAGTATYVITLGGVPASRVGVGWTVTGTGARPAAASDFGDGTALALPSSSGRLPFDAGSSGSELTRTFTIAIHDDAVPEPDAESFTVTLADPSDGLTLGTPSSVETRITDDEAAVLGIARAGPTPSRVREGGTVGFTLGLTGPVFADGTPEADRTFDITVAGAGDATAADLVDPAALTGIVFPTGTSDLTVEFRLRDDDGAEPLETLTLGIDAAAAPDTLEIDAATASVEIADVEPHAVSFDPASVRLAEGEDRDVTVRLDRPFHGRVAGASLGVTVEFDASLLLPSPGEASFPDISLGSEAGVISRDLTFAEGERERTVTLFALADAEDEGDETARLVVADAPGIDAGDGLPITIGEAGDAPAPVAAISGPATVDESAGTARYTVTLGGSPRDM